MIGIVGRPLALLLLFPVVASAHRLDEYLQAARVSVAPDGVALELELTAGVNIAADVVALIDRDRNGQITPAEATAYANTVLAEVVLTLDGRALPLTLVDVHVPAIALMREGMAAIRIEASAMLADRAAGEHHLFYRNDHQPEGSVYLVNALMPSTRAVSIRNQHRDARQREFRLEYIVSGRSSAIAWSIGAILGLAALAASRATMNMSSRSAG